MVTSCHKEPEAAVISMPWAQCNRPSIQLGTLKAYTEHISEIHVNCFHPYLHIAKKIGTSNYNIIAGNSWAGETIFSALLFPEMEDKAHTAFKESLGRSRNELPSFKNLQKIIHDACQTWHKSIDWSRFISIGFSVCFNQLLASLYMTTELKKGCNCPPVILGGSSCTGKLGESLLATFPQVDYIIDGEGEIPFSQLCRYLTNSSERFPERTRCRNKYNRKKPSPEITDLNTLPCPDYSSYFSEMQDIFSNKPFIPELPIEFSRGCWWNKCTFCNLNLQWQGYRKKDSKKMSQEITYLARKHQCLDFTFTDNALPPGETLKLAKMMIAQPIDYQFFAEIKATTTPKTLQTYRKMGIQTIQVGIEAIAPTLLDKYKKGVSVIENIAAMKYAMAENIALEANLIIEFPGSTKQEVEDTLENLEFILPFRPLKTAVFFLGFGSFVHRSPKTYGIKAILNHRKNSSLFPKSYLKTLDLLINEYRGDRIFQKKMWRPVVARVAQWHDFHLQRKNKHIQPLTYRDGSDFIIIRQEKPGTETLNHRLQGSSRQIYLFCNEIRTIDDIHTQFYKLGKNAICSFIAELCQKRLMFQEKNKVVSLAIPYVNA